MLAERLRNQKLTATRFRRPEDVVRWLGAVQAQDYLGAKWALALRAVGLGDAVIDAAFDAGRILRTHVLRPTWHFVLPEDIGWMLALNATRLRRMNMTYAARFGLDERVLARARRAIERALEGEVALTRAELAAVLQRVRIAVRGQGLAHLLFDLEQQAVITSGPRRRNQFTYMLLSERAPRTRQKSRDAALTELASRYFTSHGPATLRDFAWWSGLPMSDVRAAVRLASIEPLPEPPRLEHARGATYLLPNYDEFLIAYRDRGAVIDPERARNLGVFTTREHPHQVVVDGRVAGSWRRTVTNASVDVDVISYERLTLPQSKAVTAQAARFGAFLGRSHRITLEESK